MGTELTPKNFFPEKIPQNGKTLNISSNALVEIRKKRLATDDPIPHISSDDVRVMVEVAKRDTKYGERNSLLIATLFDAALRCKEALGIHPKDIKKSPEGYFVENVNGKSYRGVVRSGKVAISSSLALQLITYAYQNHILENEPIFPIKRARAFQIIQKVMADANIIKPDHVGSVHVLRHSGCLERLRVTGNPKSLQDQLRHRNAEMTLRYMKTLSSEESIKIQQGVDFKW